jgi:hypothetical protein
MEASKAQVMVSPVAEVEGGTSSVDWVDLDMPYEEIESLLDLYEKEVAK